MPSFCRNYGACNTKQVSHSYGFTDSHVKQESQQSRKRCRECRRKWPSRDGWVGSLKAPQRVTCSTRGCYSALWFVKSCVLCPFSFVPVFLALHFTVWHNQHHRNKTALQRALESSIYARIRGQFYLLQDALARGTHVSEIPQELQWRGTNVPTRLLFFKVPAPG